MNEPFQPRPVGGGYVNSVSLRFNPNDIPTLTELGIGYASLTPDPNYEPPTKQEKPIKWIKVYCACANCRGKKNGGKGFEVLVPEGTSPHGNRHFCNECFYR